MMNLARAWCRQITLVDLVLLFAQEKEIARAFLEVLVE